MRITHSRSPKLFDYTLGDDILASTDCHSYLGVDISNTLTWNAHINHITSSANRSLGFIKEILIPVLRVSRLMLILLRAE